MKPQELNHDEQLNTNGGSGLLDGILGGSDNNSNGHNGSGSGSGNSGSGHNGSNNGNSNDSEGSDLPIIGDLLDL